MPPRGGLFGMGLLGHGDVPSGGRFGNNGFDSERAPHIHLLLGERASVTYSRLTFIVAHKILFSRTSVSWPHELARPSCGPGCRRFGSGVV